LVDLDCLLDSYELSGEPPSFDSLLKREAGGGPLDHAAIVRAAANVPPMPGAVEMNQREAYRQRLIAANRALDGQVVNELGKGAIEGIAVAGLAVVAAVLGREVAVLGGLGLLGVAIFGGDRR
jgi:hypothetical protein